MKMLTVISCANLLSLFWCGTLSTAQAENAPAVNEVIKLKNAGVAEDTIVAFIQSKNINYDLSADSILSLKEKGVTTAVVNAMLASGTAGSPALSPDPQSVAPQPQPPAPQTPNVPQPQPPTAAVGPGATPTTSPDMAYFQQELSPYGRWILAEDGQWCWQPTIVINTPGWRPYWDKGHWIWTDQGWYWASDYSWGWAAFHYGRWNLHPHHGWIWYPDRVWGPAWVTWRSGGDYCGWAPLPPGTIYDTTGGFFRFHGRQVEAGFDFGLGLAHFSFCYTREMGEPMRQHFYNEVELRGVFNRTTIINHYSVSRVVVGGQTRVQFFNHGIEPSHLPPVRGHSFEPVHIQELRTPAPGRAHEHLDPKQRTLEVYRPGFGGHH